MTLTILIGPPRIETSVWFIFPCIKITSDHGSLSGGPAERVFVEVRDAGAVQLYCWDDWGLVERDRMGTVSRFVACAIPIERFGGSLADTADDSASARMVDYRYRRSGYSLVDDPCRPPNDRDRIVLPCRNTDHRLLGNLSTESSRMSE